MPTRPLRPPIAQPFTQFDENVISCRKTISKAERDMFFLAADLNKCQLKRLKENNSYVRFRYDYWKDDPRVLFVPSRDPTDVPGLPHNHMLSVSAYHQWLSHRQKT